MTPWPPPARRSSTALRGWRCLKTRTTSTRRGDGGHDHGHWDPHYWMDPGNAAVMVRNLQEGLRPGGPGPRRRLRPQWEEAAGQLPSFAGDCTQALEGAEGAALITFHDGFRYFAQALGLPLLASIEEEAGSEASAMEINEITQLVKEHQLPVIFTEVNGSDATANAISRETGCQVAQLTMLMDGPEGGPVHLSGRRAEQREHHRILLRGRGVGSAVRKIKHGRLAGGLLRRLLPEAGGPVGPHPRGGHPGGCVLPPPLREIVALIGPNGAGKSTLFRSILGQMPYSGTITFSPAGGPAVRLSDGANAPLAARGPAPHRLCAPVPSFDRGTR